jgi:hypothetical protein
MKSTLATLWAVVLAVGTACAAPHQEGQSYVYFSIYEHGIEGRVEIFFSDLQIALGLPEPSSDELSPSYLQAHSDTIYAYVHDRLSIKIGGEVIPYRPTGIDAMRLDRGPVVIVDYDVLYEGERPDAIEVTYTGIFDIDADHRAFVIIAHDWQQGTFANEAGGALILSPDEPTQVIELDGGSIMKGFIAMVELGVWHIWIGIDHILFLLALLLPSVLRREKNDWLPVERFRKALWNVFAIVSMFTVAHTITLSLAALGVIELSSRLVESRVAHRLRFRVVPWFRFRQCAGPSRSGDRAYGLVVARLQSRRRDRAGHHCGPGVSGPVLPP